MQKILAYISNLQDLELINLNLKESNYSVNFAYNIGEFFSEIKQFSPDLAIIDLENNVNQILNNLETHSEILGNLQLLIIGENFNQLQNYTFLNKINIDFLGKPLNIEQFSKRISQLLEIQSMRLRFNGQIYDEIDKFTFENTILSKTTSLKKISSFIKQYASTKVSILIEGELGTGKEMVARTIHYSGKSKEDPFIYVNCTNKSDEEILEELLGTHHKNNGKHKAPIFEIVGSGTIYFDEISNLSIKTQKFIYDLLETREYESNLDKEKKKINSRLILATNKDLGKLVEQGEFLKELYEKLQLFSIKVPPLRDRKEDMNIITEVMLKKLCKVYHKKISFVPDDTLEVLKRYSWPGNLKELESVLIRAIILSKTATLNKQIVCSLLNIKVDEKFDVNMKLDQVEKLHISNVMRYVKGNKARAIRILGISKPTLYSKLKKYEIVK